MKALQQRLLEFGRLRDWEQFHNPKNLAAALAVESAELLEIFQWLNEEQSQNLEGKKREDAAMELADVFMYTLLLANKLNIDLLEASEKKLKINEARYPVELSHGKALKYNELEK